MQTSPAGARFHCTCNQIKYNTQLPYPQSRNKFASCLHENFIYIYAGKDGTISLRDFWRFNICNHTWQQVSFRGDLPSHLEGHTLVSCKKLLLLFGGEFGDSLTESSLWIINPDLGYIRKSNLDPGSERPSVRRHHTAVVYRGCMFVYGGYVDMKGSSSELWQYRIDDEEWDLLLPRQPAQYIPSGLHGHTAVVYNKYMWVYGGMSDLMPKQDLWCYNFVSSQWDRVKCKYGPPALMGHSAVVIESQMFIFGGECNREPVNQLWCFCFRNELWTQVQCHQHMLSARMFHSAVTVSPLTKSDSSVKACSMPYLQNKINHLTLERPRTSPGSRSQGSLHFNDNHFSDKELGLRPQVLSLQENSSSCESLKILPSPAENTQDHSPLVPKKTDFNYNILSKNNVINGIDNPGISKSTEELIRENMNLRLSKLNEENKEFNVKLPFLRSQSQSASSLLGESQDKQQTYIRQSSEGFDYTEGTPSDDLVYKLRAKKLRPDPDLIIEDLEYKDCFPYDIKIPYPTSKTPLKSFRILDIGLPVDGLETIELTDLKTTKEANLCYGQKTSHDILRKRASGSFYGANNLIDFIEVDKRFKEVCKNSSENSGTLEACGNTQREVVCVEMESDTRSNTLGSGSVSVARHGTFETSFTSRKVEGASDWNVDGSFIAQTNTNENKSVQLDTEPYMLILGGKEKQGTNFGIKPLGLWKCKLKKQ